jgi:hypothetical protein
VALVRTDVSEERISSIIRVTRIGQLGTTLTATSIIVNTAFLRPVFRFLVTYYVSPISPILFTLTMEKIPSSQVIIRAILRAIPENGNLHNHHRENLKSYIALIGWTL